MDTAEVSSKTREVPRLVRATALLVAGASIHMWLFPFHGVPGRPGALERLAARVTSLSSDGVVGTTGDDGSGVVRSALGAAVPSVEADARAMGFRLRDEFDRVKVLIETVHPTTVLSPIPRPPAAFQNAVFRTALATAPTVREWTPPAPTTGPASFAEAAGISGTSIAGDLDMPRQPKPVVFSPLSPNVSEPAAHTAHTGADVAVRSEGPSDERLVSYVLQQYREAYESLDVSAAQTVWPTVDARALSAAFRQLAGQRVTFESCGVSVSGSGSQATARCTGQAEYVPKVGSRRAYTASGEWVFDLQKENAAWRITNANANIK